MITPNICVSIVGNPKSGKTHFSLTFPEPIVVYSFDLRGVELIKHKFGDKAIDVKTFLPPITTTKVPDAKVQELWNKIQADYAETIGSGAYKTVVIDPATMLWEIIRHSFAVEEGKVVVGKPRNYGEPNARMTWIITSPLVSGMNVVVTNYMKDVYKDDMPTGEKALDGFKRTEGLVDVCLLTEMDKRPASAQERKEGRKEISVPKATIYLCRFDPDLNGLELDRATYDDLIALLGVGE